MIVLVFSFLSPHFFTANNLVSILTAATVTGILALGTTFVIITGGIDLSIGTVMVLCGVMAGVFLTYLGWPLWAGVVATILFGGLIGLINGVNISVFGIPPFIATLGMMLIAAGLSLVISGNEADLLHRDPRLPVDHEPVDHPGHAVPARRRDLHRDDRGRGGAPVQDDPRALHVLDRIERGRNGTLGRQRAPLEDHHLHARRSSSSGSRGY